MLSIFRCKCSLKTLYFSFLLNFINCSKLTALLTVEGVQSLTVFSAGILLSLEWIVAITQRVLSNLGIAIVYGIYAVAGSSLQGCVYFRVD